MYLAVWAGYQLYDLMSPSAALVYLAFVVAAGGALAVRYNSMALAIMAALGGFLNPILVSTGRDFLGALYLYLLLLNAGTLALAVYKCWRALTAVAMSATWLLALIGWAGALPSERFVALGFGTAYLLMFHSALLLRYLRTEEPSENQDLFLSALNSLAFFVLGMVALPDSGRPLFALLVGLAHIGLAVGWRTRRRGESSAVLAFLGLGIGAVTMAVALQFEGSVLATVWTIEAVLIMLAAVRTELSKLRLAGLVVFGLSIGLSLLSSGLGTRYDPARPLFSMEALPFVTQVAALAGTAFMLRRHGDSVAERRGAESAEVLAIVLAGIWLTFELSAHYQRAGWEMRTLPFAIATFWAAYAAAAGAAGTRRRTAWARPLALSIFSLSLATSILATGLGSAYEPSRLLLSIETLTFVVQIAILGAAAVAIRRTGSTLQEARIADGAAVLANLLVVFWLTLETWAHQNRPDVDWSFATFTFTLSSVWALYAAGLLAFGIGLRARWARLVSVSLFGLVILKLVLADVWLLETPLRIAALVGLGLVLLLCSLGYHRFRSLILGPDDPGGAAAQEIKAA